MKLFALGLLLGAAPAAGAMVVESLPRLGALPPAAGPVPTTVPPLPSAAPALTVAPALTAPSLAPAPAVPVPAAAPVAARPVSGSARGFAGPAALASARAVAASAGDGTSFDGSLSASAESRSSISNVYGSGPVSDNGLLDASIAPHHVPPWDVKVLSPGSRSAAAVLRRFWHDFRLEGLAVSAAPREHLTRFAGEVPAGSSREIQWPVGPLSLTLGNDIIRRTSPYTGLQVSLSLDGGSDAIARTSLVFYARRRRAEIDGGFERLKFVGALPAAPVTAVLENGEAPSYAVDFADMILEGDPDRRSLAYLLLNVEIDGVGLAFDAGKENLKIAGAVFGEMYFLSDLAKSPADFARYLERLAPNTLVEELMEDLPFLSSRKLHDILRAMAIPGAEEMIAGDPWRPGHLAAGHLSVEKLIASNKQRLRSLDRSQLISFFEDRPILATRRPNYPHAPGGSEFDLNYWDPPHGLMPILTKRLYDPARQEHTLRVLRKQGIGAIYDELKPHFDHVELPLLSFARLWERVAPYEGAGPARSLFHIPIDIGDFGKDHLEVAHALALHTILYDMSRQERDELIMPPFRHMQKTLEAFTYLWTLIFEAPGSATPNSPRYWRDRVRASSRGA